MTVSKKTLHMVKSQSENSDLSRDYLALLKMCAIFVISVLSSYFSRIKITHELEHFREIKLLLTKKVNLINNCEETSRKLICKENEHFQTKMVS